MTYSVDSVSAYLAVSEEGEGIIAFPANGVMMPMVMADEERIRSLRPMAAAIARASNKRVVLARFSVREDMEIIEP